MPTNIATHDRDAPILDFDTIENTSAGSNRNLSVLVIVRCYEMRLQIQFKTIRIERAQSNYRALN